MAAGCAKHYQADGMILRMTANSALISHRDIKNYMPAMTMEFPLAKPLPPLAPGTRVTFELKAAGHRTAITRLTERAEPAATFTLPKPAAIATGTVVPEFTLTDQTGAEVSLSALRGRVLALNFIYTRCPLPDVCPRLSANFARLARRFGDKITLLSVTLDPQYDTPPVLAGYAKLWRANPENWRFLTGSPDVIHGVASTFGVLYFPEENSMTHTSETAVIDRRGRLAGIVEGSSYAVSQLGDLIAYELEKP